MFLRFFVRFSLALTLLFSGLSAYEIDTNTTTVYKQDFGIYVYGDVEAIENAFILVQAIATSNELDTLIALMMAFFLPYAAYRYFSDGSGKTFFTNITFATASILFLNTDGGMPSASIHIEDLRTQTNWTSDLGKTYAKVDDIPYPIALLTSTVSTVTDTITILFEDAVGLIEPDLVGTSTVSVGYMSTIQDLMKIITSASFEKLKSAPSQKFSRSLTAYVEQCGFGHALSVNPDLIKNFRNPSKDLYKSIDPASLNITGAAYEIGFTDSNGTKTQTCQDFWTSEIEANLITIADEMKTALNEITIGDMTSADIMSSYSVIGGDINDTVVSTQIGKFNAYLLNLGARAPVSKAFANSAMDVSSGQDLANAITAGVSMGEMQMEGIGRLKWMAEVLPYGFHFMLGVIYSISILIMIVASSMGAVKGFSIWKNFAKGLMTFEFIKVSLVIINATVNQYAAHHAADFLASVGQNPAALDTLPYHYHYLANMAGIGGILGVAAIFMIPAMVFSGDVSMAAGAIGSLAGRYKGNDARTAQSTTAEQQSKQDAYEREMQDKAMLDNLGVSVPSGMSASDYYAEYKRGAEAAGAGWGSYNMQGKLADVGTAAKGQTVQGVSSASTLAQNNSMSEFVSAGVGQGVQQTKSMASMSAYGENLSASDSKLSGAFEGTMSAAKDSTIASMGTVAQARTLGTDSSLQQIGKAKGLMESKAFNADGTINTTSKDLATGQLESDKYLQGLTNQSRIGVNKTMGLGRLGTLSEADMTDVQRVSQAGALGEFAKGDALQKKYGNNLDNKIVVKDNKGNTIGTADGYSGVASANAQMQEDKAIGSAAGYNSGKITPQMMQQNAAYGLVSSALSTNEKISKQGGFASSVNTDVTEAGLKADTQQKVLTAQIKAGGASGLNDSADKIASAIEKLANTSATLVGGKTKSDMASIKEAGGSEAYMKLQADSSVMKTKQQKGSVLGQQIVAENLDGQQNMLDKLLGSASPEKRAAMKNDLVKSGWIDENEKVQEGKYIEARAALSANNIMGSNSMGIGGSVVSGSISATGANSTAKVDGQDTSKMGQTMDFGRQANVMAKTYNLGQEPDKQVKLNSDGTIDYQNTSKEAMGGFLDFMKTKQDAGELEKGFLSTAVTKTAQATGLSEEAVLGTMAGVGAYGLNKMVGNPGGKIWDKTKSALPQNSMPNNSSNIDDNHRSTKNNDTTKNQHSHNDSFQKDMSNYTKEYGESKGLLDAETKNMDSLLEQKEAMEMEGKDTTRIDEKIDASNANIEKHKGDMNVADRNIKATKFNASKSIPKSKWGFISKAAASVLASVGVASAGEIGEDIENTMSLLDPTSFFTGTQMGNGELTPEMLENAKNNSQGTPASPLNLKDIMSKGPAGINGIVQAAQSDPGMAPAIDSFNTQQNIQAMQSAQPNSTTTMQSRGGEIGFTRRAKDNTLMMQLPDQTFPTNTNIPFGEFQDTMNDPQQQQQLAQMVAQSNFDGGNGGGIAKAQDMEQFKAEMDMNFMRNNMQIRNIRSNSNMTTDMIEEQADFMEEIVSDTLDNVSDSIDDISKKMERLH